MDTKFVFNNLKINARIFYPDVVKDKNPAVLLLHGWATNQESNSQYANALAKIGFIVLTYDMPGHGLSEGSFEKTSRHEFLEAALAAYDFLASQPKVDNNNISVGGSSFGGYLSILVSKNRRVTNLILRAPANYSDDGFDKSHADFSGDNKPNTVRKKLESINENQTMATKALNGFSGQVLLVDSEKDEVIPRKIIEAYRKAVTNQSKLTYVVMEDAPHGISQIPKLRTKFTKILLDWFSDNP